MDLISFTNFLRSPSYKTIDICNSYVFVLLGFAQLYLSFKLQPTSTFSSFLSIGPFMCVWLIPINLQFKTHIYLIWGIQFSKFNIRFNKIDLKLSISFSYCEKYTRRKLS